MSSCDFPFFPQLLSILDGLYIPPSAWLMALYFSIPHDRGIGVVNGFLQERNHNQWSYNCFITDLLHFILTQTHNVSVFNRSHYLQVQGVGMGTCCAPSCVNLYLGGGGAGTVHQRGLLSVHAPLFLVMSSLCGMPFFSFFFTFWKP